MDDFYNFQEKVKQSFANFKDHMNELETKITDVEANLGNINKELDYFKEKIEELIKIIDILHKNMSTSSGSSIGNEGVMHRCISAPSVLQRQLNDVETLQKKFKDLFLKLTNAEFNLFVAIYSLEEETGQAVSHTQLASRLGLSPVYIREVTRTLTLKGLPIVRYKDSNKKVLLLISREFRDLKIVSKLIKLRNFDIDQKELFSR